MKRMEGFVATLDVLGFGEILYRSHYQRVLQNYLDTINKVISGRTSSECVVFSDSIVLTSPTHLDGPNGFEALIITCSAVFRALLVAGFPVRGAIAYGSYWRETSHGSVFLAGRPIVEAYEREKAQKWVGILVCPSVLHQISDLKELTWIPKKPEEEELWTSRETSLRLQPAEAVPFQEAAAGQTLSGYGVVPLRPEDDIHSAHRYLGNVISKLRTLRLQASHPSAQAKYGATVKWLEAINARFKALSKGIFAISTK
jgi:hypothetical protein